MLSRCVAAVLVDGVGAVAQRGEFFVAQLHDLGEVRMHAFHLVGCE